ncbi:hypothetical protein Y694_04703 [Methylibium sp. T29-B]|uniref:hypothetical protein n=1 Tax=Methylibium sp. T29-B TaxID=1437443 RepID=UPI0003F3E3B3|nr:hypothetical protein [Methylibium sp. T29-B]EWS57236.1 hypothetical protein Y694_04703 [Methylibium sp. T29-B]
MGPTGFAILPSAAEADAVLAAARAAGMVEAALQLRTVGARAHGASIEVRPPPR